MVFVPTVTYIPQPQASLEAQELARDIEDAIVRYQEEHPSVRQEDIKQALQLARSRAGTGRHRSKPGLPPTAFRCAIAKWENSPACIWQSDCPTQSRRVLDNEPARRGDRSREPAPCRPPRLPPSPKTPYDSDVDRSRNLRFVVCSLLVASCYPKISIHD